MRHRIKGIEPEPVEPELEWEAKVNSAGCFELYSNRQRVMHVTTDGIVRMHVDSFTERGLKIFVPGPPKPSWNTNVSELKNHYGKLVTVKGVEWGPHSGILRHLGGETLGVSGPQGDEWSFGLKTFVKFCVHELPE